MKETRDSVRSFDEFEELHEETKRLVDEELDSIISEHEESEDIRQLLRQGVYGGKRLRPTLTMAMAEVCDVSLDQTVKHMAIVELIHDATLVADDYADDDVTRRGIPTVWKLVERLPYVASDKLNPRTFTILTENGMLALALKEARDPGVVTAMGDSVHQVYQGFHKEGKAMYGQVFGSGYETYIDVNKLKTGGLFALACKLPAICSYHDEATEKAAWTYGQMAGVLYQIADDLTDDELPHFVDEPADELELWYDRAMAQLQELPIANERDQYLLETAPAWCVTKLLEQEGMGDICPSFESKYNLDPSGSIESTTAANMTLSE